MMEKQTALYSSDINAEEEFPNMTLIKCSCGTEMGKLNFKEVAKQGLGEVILQCNNCSRRHYF